MAIDCFDHALRDVGITTDPLRTVLHDYFAWATTTTMARYPESADDVPEGAVGAKFTCDRADVGAVSKWLAANGWTVVTSEVGYVPKVCPELTDAQREEVGEFLQALEENDDVHRVWAALK